MPFRVVFNRGPSGTNTLTINSGRQFNTKRPGDQIGQYRNLVLWLRETNPEPFYFLLAEGGQWKKKGDHWFMKGGDTWFALYPINLGKITPSTLDKREKKRMPQANLWSAKTGPGPISGFALEIGEKGQHGNFNAFMRAVRKTRGLRVEADNPHAYTFEGTDGRVLGMTLQADTDLPVLARDGVIRQWDNSNEWACNSIDDES